jgi:hypothetical protein
MNDSPKKRGRPLGSKNKPKTCATESAQPKAVRGSGLTPWKPGQSGNPAGRKPGSRNALSESFLSQLHRHFQEHGASAIDAVYNESPVDYLKVVASVVPKQFGLEEGTQNAFLECWRAISEGRA